MKRLRLALTALLFATRIALAQVATGNPATIPVPRAAPWWVARHQEKVRAAQHGNIDLLFVGDSITQNYEALYPDLWDRLFAPHRALNLGFSGDETQHVLWRLQNGELQGLNPTHVVLLIGTNNTSHGQTAPQVTSGIVAIVEQLHRLLPNASILIVDILPTLITRQKSTTDQAINEAINHHYANSPYALPLDLTPLFHSDGSTDPNLFYDTNGALHPNAEGQRRMAEAIAKALYPAE